MERLKNSIIRKSKSKRVDLNSKEAKIKKIYRFALNNRGGQMEFASDYEVAEKIRDIVLRLAAFLKQRELKGILKIIFAQGRLILELILCTSKIQLDYVVVGELNPQVIVIAITTGGVTGFTLSWIGAGAMLISGPTILTAFLLRSLNQQVKHFHQVAELKRNLLALVKDREVQETIQSIVVEIPSQGVNNLEMKPSLHWNTDPKIQEAVEQLGILENPADTSRKLHLDPFDPKTIEFLKELGVDTNPIGMGEKTRPRAKTVYLTDLIDQNGDVAD